MITDTSYTTDHVAQLEAIRNVQIRARLNGFIDAIKVDEGQQVVKDQVLFLIGKAPFQQELQQAVAATGSARARMQASEIQLGNSKKLLDRNIISTAEYAVAEAEVQILRSELEMAQAAEERARLNLQFTEVRAPFTGTVNRIPNKEGSLVEEGTLLTTISDDSQIYAYFNVSETDHLNHTIDDGGKGSKELSLLLATGALYPFSGAISTTESEFDPNTGTIAYRATFPNPHGLLKHGATGRVQVTKQIAHVLVIPQSCTFDRQEQLCVYVVGADSTLKVRSFETQVRLPHLFVISSGLSELDQILYEGVQLVKEGDRIVPQSAEFSQPTNH
jgi:membrane fusion protein (multidrug efflux system)